MTTYGTSHFVSKAAAIQYYRASEGCTAQARYAVEQKIRDGEIHVGKPKLKDGETLTTVDAMYIIQGGR